MIPLTRPISVMFHQPIALKVQEVADDEYDGKMSEYIRQLVLLDLLRRECITLTDLEGLR